MIIALASIASALQGPKTFQELELAKVIAFQSFQQLHYVAESKVAGSDEGPVTFRLTYDRDGRRSYGVIEAPGNIKIEQIDDGTTTWTIFHGQKSYWVLNDASAGPFIPKDHLLQAQPSSFNINLAGIGPIQFASDPPLKLESLTVVNDNGKTMRKAVADAIGHQGHHITVTEWFAPDRWLAERAEVSSSGDQAAMKTTSQVTAFDLNPTFMPNEFVLDSAKVAGYKRNIGSAPKIGL